MTQKNENKAGFTLVELSIVLVIVGLIVGGVLTGRQIMQGAQVTNVVNAIQAFDSQFKTYTQNYNAMPGDDKNVTAHFTGSNIETTLNGGGDGSLSGNFDSTSPGDETSKLWGVLRAANLVKGAAGDTSLPGNPFGGIYGIQRGAFSAGEEVSETFSTNVICLTNVPGDSAAIIDSKLDNGEPNSGTVMAMQSPTDACEENGCGASGTVAGSYSSASTYTVCAKM